MKHNTQLNQSGVASILVVLFMSIILTVLTLGFVRIALDEQRQSTDEDLSSRAFYAAESGLEDAKRAVTGVLNGTIAESDLNANVCEGPGGAAAAQFPPQLSTEFDTEYTCQIIDLTPSVYRAEMTSANQTRQININAVDDAGNSVSYSEAKIRWHINETAANDGDGLVLNGANGGTINLEDGTNAFSTAFPTAANWSSASLLEVSTIAHPNSFTSADIVSARNYITPTDGGAATAFDPFANDALRVPGACSRIAALGEYACEATLDLTSVAPNRILRITNLYAPTTIEVTLLDASGDPVSFEGSQVVVDVTGRAGEVYRRVEAVLDIDQQNVLPNFTIQSATRICKDFSVSDTSSTAIDNTSCSLP